MTTIRVHPAESGKAAAANPFLAKVENALAAVRERAFQLFEKRGKTPGCELADWLQAEQELFFVPRAELTEDSGAFTMKIQMQGFEAANVGYQSAMGNSCGSEGRRAAKDACRIQVPLPPF